MASPKRRRWRQAWVVSVRVPAGRAELYPLLRDGAVLGVLHRRTSRQGVEAAMTALLHAFVLDDDSDRFDVLVDEAPYTPVWNSVSRHGELDYTGLPVIVADRARVRMSAGGAFEWDPQPWPASRSETGGEEPSSPVLT